MEVKSPLLWHSTLLAPMLLVKPLSQTTSTTFPVTPDMESSVALFEFGTDVGLHPPAAHTMEENVWSVWQVASPLPPYPPSHTTGTVSPVLPEIESATDLSEFATLVDAQLNAEHCTPFPW